MKKHEVAALGFPENLGTALRNSMTNPEVIRFPKDNEKILSMMKDFLPERFYEIMVDRYVGCMGLLDIGVKRGLSYERVRQIVDKSERDLRYLFSSGDPECEITDIRDMSIPVYFRRIKKPSRALRIASAALIRAWSRGGVIVCLRPSILVGYYAKEIYPFETVGDLIVAIKAGVITRLKGIAEKSRRVIVEQLLKDGVDDFRKMSLEEANKIVLDHKLVRDSDVKRMKGTIVIGGKDE